MNSSSDPHDFKLKPLSRDAVEAALSKAEHYRLLNQPRLAESICQDILEVDANNQKAMVVLLLALTDQFGASMSSRGVHAQQLANSLKDEFSKVYYMGIIHERLGNVALDSSTHGSDWDAYEWYVEAMEFFERAEKLSPPGNNDAILRWNTCARTIMQHKLHPRPADAINPMGD